MKIVVMSDSHGFDENVREVMKRNQDADYFLHLGDLCSDYHYFPDMIFVRGNNEYDYSVPDRRIVSFNGVNIYMLHSHQIGYLNREYKLANLGKENDCQIVLFGHTHTVEDYLIDGIRVLNPGSLYYNRDYKPMGYYIIEINKNSEYQISRKDL